MARGLLIKGYNGFYYVSSEGSLWACSLRGKFRLTKQEFLPGDDVEFTVVEDGKGVIEKVADRTNRLVRPAVANVETALITFAVKDPAPDLLLLDRILVQVLQEHIRPVLCFNKSDLLSTAAIDELIRPYRAAGFTVLRVSAATGEGMDAVKAALSGSISVLAGPSGVGKSSLINGLGLGYDLATGTLSKKTDRGRHTTRRVELMPLGQDTYIVDTPGFSSLHLPKELTKEALAAFYPEFQVAAACPFKSCLHYGERDCGVKDAVAAGEIDAGRYDRYRLLLEELKEKENRY